MGITKEKLKMFISDRLKYHQGSLDCNSSGINDPENLKYKEAIDAGLKSRLKVNRPNDQDFDDNISTGLSFQDRASGAVCKAYGPGEKLFDSGEDFSVGKILRAKIIGNYEGLNDYEMRSAGEGTGTLGGFLTTPAVSAKIIDLARNFAVIAKAGSYVLPMTAPEMRLVKLAKDVESHFKAEHAAGVESDFTLEDLNLKAMKCIAITRVSIELLEDAANSGQMLEMSLGKSIGLLMDKVALLGTGVSEPLGIDHAAGINIISMGTNGAAPTNYDPLSNAIEDVANNNGIAGAIIMAPRSYFQLDRLKAGESNNRLEMPLSVQEIKDAGKIFHTNQCPTNLTQGTATNSSTIYCGDFKQMVFGILKGLRLEMTRTGGTKTFSQYECLIRAVCRFDIGILRDNHFSKVIGLIP